MEKVTLLERRLKQVKETFEALKKSGINEEILIAYLQNKTKMSRKAIKRMLDNIEQFYEDLVSKEVANAL
jgi:hypothetical protein